MGFVCFVDICYSCYCYCYQGVMSSQWDTIVVTLLPSKVLSPTSEKCSSYLRTTTSTSKLCAWAEVGFSTLTHVVHGHGGGDVHGGG